VVEVNCLKVSSQFLPCGFAPIEAIEVSGQVIALSESGELAFSRPNSGEMTNDWIPAFPIPLRQPVAFLSFYKECVIFVKGTIPPRPFVPPAILVDSGRFLSAVADTVVCANSQTAYFATRTYPTSELSAIVAASDTNSFVTGSGRIIRVDEDGRRLFEQNFVRGDRLVIQRNRESFNVIVAGFADGAVWVYTPGSRSVVALPPLPPKLLSNSIASLERPDHIITKVTVDGATVWADVTPSFCAQFGYEPGDLILSDAYGTVEFFGLFAGSLLFLELSVRTLLFLPELPYKVLKRVSKNLPHSQTVITPDGNVITIDISSDGPRIFIPTDRVLSPLGEATVIGFKDVPYIQTDAMRMLGYEAVVADIFTLSLLRRINRRAVRTTEIDNEPKQISLNTEDSVDRLFPGDAIFVDSVYGKVVGFCGGRTVVRFNGESKCKFTDKVPEIIYRADIQAVRVCRDFPPVNVGSPLIPETTVLPGDIVVASELGECEFLGYTEENTIFVSTATGEQFNISFAMLLYPDFFRVSKRNSLIEVNS
jgi:hypothetical protein